MAFNEDELIQIQRIVLEKRKQDLIDEIEQIRIKIEDLKGVIYHDEI